MVNYTLINKPSCIKLSINTSDATDGNLRADLVLSTPKTVFCCCQTKYNNKNFKKNYRQVAGFTKKNHVKLFVIAKPKVVRFKKIVSSDFSISIRFLGF